MSGRDSEIAWRIKHALIRKPETPGSPRSDVPWTTGS